MASSASVASEKEDIVTRVCVCVLGEEGVHVSVVFVSKRKSRKDDGNRQIMIMTTVFHINAKKRTMR